MGFLQVVGDVRRRTVAVSVGEGAGTAAAQEPEEDEGAIEARRAAVRERCVRTVGAGVALCCRQPLETPFICCHVRSFFVELLALLGGCVEPLLL